MSRCMITDYDELFERFSIMTIDGNMSDKQAFDYLKSKTTPELLSLLDHDIMEYTIGNNS